MTEQTALDVGLRALILALQLAAPPLIAALVVGMAVSVFQAVTQINEITLSFVPKILAIAAVLTATGPWMGSSLVAFTVDLFTALPGMAR